MDTAVTGDGPATAHAPETEQLWREMLAQLRVFVRRRIADPDRAEDLVADILLRVHQNMGSLDDRERLSHWMYRIARNAVVDEYRRAGRARERLVPDFVDRSDDPGDDEPGAVAELAHCLRPLLAGLPPEQRRAVEMVDLDGLPQARAAELERVSLSGMKSRVQRGRRRLADLLSKCCVLTLDGRGVPMDYVRPPRCDCAHPR